jgi:cell division protein FtsL
MRTLFRPDLVRRSAGAVAPVPVGPSLAQRLRALRPILLAALLVFSAAGLGVAHVTLRLRQLDLGYALSRAASEQADLAERRRRLRIEVASLKSPDRVLRLARQRLDLAPPAPGQVRRVSP